MKNDVPSSKLVRRRSSTFTDPSNFLAIQELRSRILQDSNVESKYCEEDILRIRNEDWWLDRFLNSVNQDVDIANAIILECLKWRKNFQVDRISLLELKPLLDSQLMYLHGKDMQNRHILWINMRKYKNGDDGFEKIFTFWMDRHFMEYNGTQPLTLFIDMSGTGLKNMSFDVMKFVLHSSKYYYPNSIAMILIFDSPAILNASWKVIGSWLEPSSFNSRHDLLTSVTRSSVTHYVPKSFLLESHGGTDTFKFTMDEIAKCLPPPPPPKPSPKLIQQRMHSIDDSANNNITEFDFSSFQKRNVKFEDDSTVKRAPSISRRSSRGAKGRKSHIPPSLRPLIERRVNSSNDFWSSNDFVSVTPRDELTLEATEEETDFVDVVLVRNQSLDQPIMFKFKTTSPEKFRVRPSCGVVSPGATEIIRVYLQYDYRHSWSKEKFLLLTMEEKSADLEAFSEKFKNAVKKAEFKFKCRLSDNVKLDEPNERKSSFLQQQALINAKQNSINFTINQPMTIVILILFLLFQFLYILQVRSDNLVLRDMISTLSGQLRDNSASTHQSIDDNINNEL